MSGRGDLGAEYRKEIVARLEASDWHGAYTWAKGWIDSGGGAFLLDPWLAYVAATLLHGQPRTAIHSVDLALAHWIDRDADRSILYWVRSRIIRFKLNDPKAAMSDLDAAARGGRAWLRDDINVDIRACAQRKASVDLAPASVGSELSQVTASTSADHRATFAAASRSPVPVPGSVPELWPYVVGHLEH